MSPRIQVYKAIACRMLTRDAGPNASFGQRCDDLAVQARAAKIQASVVTIMSILSALSTGFWSKLGDTRGRKLILSTFLIGALSMEAVFMLVMRPESFFGRRAERVILVGPVIEGLTGGLSTFNGVVHAYISDCTQHGSRSTIFSTVQGMIFVGLAIGPWVTSEDSYSLLKVTTTVSSSGALALSAPYCSILFSFVRNRGYGFVVKKALLNVNNDNVPMRERRLSTLNLCWPCVHLRSSSSQRCCYL